MPIAKGMDDFDLSCLYGIDLMLKSESWSRQAFFPQKYLEWITHGLGEAVLSNRHKRQKVKSSFLVLM